MERADGRDGGVTDPGEGLGGGDGLMIRLASAQAEIRHAEHDRSNPAFRSRYASLASIVAAVRGPLTRHGIALTTEIVEADMESALISVSASLHHRDESISSGPVVMPITKARRGGGPTRCDPAEVSAQAIGAALTYGRRQAIQLVVGLLASDEDRDGRPLEIGGAPDDDLGDLTADDLDAVEALPAAEDEEIIL